MKLSNYPLVVQNTAVCAPITFQEIITVIISRIMGTEIISKTLSELLVGHCSPIKFEGI